MSTIIGLMLLTSQVALYTQAFKAAYTIVALLGIVMTVRFHPIPSSCLQCVWILCLWPGCCVQWGLRKLRERAKERLALAHVAPVRRDQLLLRPVLPR